MDLSNLQAPIPNRKKARRKGRGQGSGRGEQSGRGHKGQKSNSGYTYKPYFEGGQMPLQRRIPKFGFKNPFRSEYQVVNVNDLQGFIKSGKLGETITIEDLRNAGLVGKKEKIKLLGDGDIDKKVDIEVHAYSKSAGEKIEKAGGSITVVDQ